MDNEDVQTEQEKEVTEAPAPASEQAEQPATLTEERVQQMIAEATSKAVDEAKEAGRRELQGQQARNRNAEQRVRTAEAESASYKESFSGLDEDIKDNVELKRLQSREKNEGQRVELEQYNTQLKQSLRDEVKTLGIDPDDNRIDYALEAGSYFEGRKLFSESTAKILRAKDTEKDKALDDKFKQFKSDIRKELELDNVDTSTPIGGDGSDEAFRKLMSDPDHVTTAEDLKRIEKIQTKNKGG